MSQNVSVIPSQKFYHARRQWRIEVGGYTVLRLTYGTTGGTLKTATAADDWGRPVYPNCPRLMHALACAVEKHLSPAIEIFLREDSQQRQFLEFSETGTLSEFLMAAKILGEEIFKCLSQPSCLTVAYRQISCQDKQVVAAG